MKYKFTPEYCNQHENKVAIHVLSTDEVRKCDEILNNKRAHDYLTNVLPYGATQCISAFNSEHCDFNYYSSNGYVIIKAEDFIRENTKENMENKKIIGYILKEDCKQFEKAACYIANIDHLEKMRMPGVAFAHNSEISLKLKKASVLDLWFDKVYEEEQFKVGDWVYDIENKFTNIRDRVLPISKIDEENRVWGADFNGMDTYLPMDRFAETYRKATPEEIKEAMEIKIGDYKVEKIYDAYQIGCKTIQRSELISINDFMIRSSFNEVSFDGKKVSLETINKILNMK